MDKKIDGTEITITLFMFSLIKRIVREFDLTPEQETRLHEIAQKDIEKLYD